MLDSNGEGPVGAAPLFLEFTQILALSRLPVRSHILLFLSLLPTPSLSSLSLSKHTLPLRHILSPRSLFLRSRYAISLFLLSLHTLFLVLLSFFSLFFLHLSLSLPLTPIFFFSLHFNSQVIVNEKIHQRF